MQNKLKNISIVAILFISLNILVYYIVEQNSSQRIQTSLDKHIDKLQTHYNIVLEHQKNIADSIYKRTIIQQEVIDLVSKAWETKNVDTRKNIRDKLHDLLQQKYKIMHNYGVLQYHFVFPDNIVFLRMHKPSKYDDDLSNIRLDFKRVNETKQIVRGLSPGRTSHAFRNIYPLYDDKKNYIGSLDIAFPSEKLQNSLTSISKIHTHFLLNKKVLDVKAWTRDDIKPKYLPSVEHKDYLLAMTKEHNKENCIKTLGQKLEGTSQIIDENIDKNSKFGFCIPFDDKIKVLSFLPINDSIQNTTIAWLVSYENDDFIKSTLEGATVIKSIAFFILLIISYFLYRILNQKILLDIEVKKKTKELKDINNNLEQKVKEEVDKNMHQQIQLFEQSKMAIMGTMIGNIAHQWRQPLSIISTTASAVNAEQEYSVLDNTTLPEKMNLIVDQVNYLSDTITTFRNFLKEKKEIQTLVLQDRIKVSLSIVAVVLKDNNIKLIDNINYNKPIEVTIVVGELSQVIINILNNARDILLEKNIKEPWIKINLIEQDNKAIITIEDNGGGIPDDIIHKIFDEYFTTKDDSKGTGLGMHMSRKIIVESLKGELYVKNTENGAKFFIELPLKV